VSLIDSRKQPDDFRLGLTAVRLTAKCVEERADLT
jgi:hypothetical protein